MRRTEAASARNGDAGGDSAVRRTFTFLLLSAIVAGCGGDSGGPVDGGTATVASGPSGRFDSPDRVEAIASAMLTRNPDLDGMYTTWADPATGVLAAIRSRGATDVKVTTADLSEPIAVDMARGGPVVGVATDPVFGLGRTMADVAALGLLNRSAPPFTVADSVAARPDNLLDAWKESYGEPAPSAVLEAAGK